MLLELLNWFSNADEALKTGSILLFMLIIYLETGTLLGLVVPGGDYMVLTSGILISTGAIEIDLFVYMILLWMAAVAGDFTGYIQGRLLGANLEKKKDTWLFKKAHLHRSRAFYNKYGVRAFIAGRFMPVIRTFVPLVAGASLLPANRFILFSAIGSACWIGLLVASGYYLAKFFPGIIHYTSWLLLIIVILASLPFIKLFLSYITRKLNK